MKKEIKKKVIKRLTKMLLKNPKLRNNQKKFGEIGQDLTIEETAKQIFEDIGKQVESMNDCMNDEPCCKWNIKKVEYYCSFHHLTEERIPKLKKKWLK